MVSAQGHRDPRHGGSARGVPPALEDDQQAIDQAAPDSPTGGPQEGDIVYYDTRGQEVAYRIVDDRSDQALTGVIVEKVNPDDPGEGRISYVGSGLPDNFYSSPQQGDHHPDDPNAPAPETPTEHPNQALIEQEEKWREEEREREKRNARAYLESYLSQWGLEGLGDMVWNEIQRGAGQEEVLQAIRDSDEYASRFPGMSLREQQGLPAISEEEYLQYERQATQIMRQAGMPSDFYDNPSDLATLIGNDISPSELSDRVVEAWRSVAQAPGEVQQAFDQYFGVDGDRALATYFLDPDRATELLMDEVERAWMGGTASRFDLDVDEGRIEELQRLGLDRSTAMEAFGEVGMMQERGVFQETVGERGQSMTAEGTGVDAVAAGDPSAQVDIERRQEGRAAAFAGAPRTQQITRLGTGLGTAGRRRRQPRPGLGATGPTGT